MVKLEIAKDNNPIISFKNEVKKYYFSSRFAPLEEAIRLAEPFKKKPQDFIVMLGSGHLTLILYICQNIKLEKLIIIEASKEIALITKQYIKNNFSEKQKTKILFYLEEEYKNLEIWFKNKTANDVQIFTNRTQIALFDEFYKKAYDDVIAFYNQKSINVTTISRFEKLWLRNLMKNTFSIAKSYGINHLRNSFKGKKAIIIGAGPSLKNNINDLKKIQNSVFIIAVDTVLKVLLHHNIKPHFVVVVDPQKINSRYVENIPNKVLDSTCFICEPAICQSAIRDKKYCITFDTIFPFYKMITKHFGKKGEIDMGGNVSTTAYDVALYLGFDEVALVGLDMCFTKDAYHVEGSLYENLWFSSIDRFHTHESKIHKLMDYKNLTKITSYDKKTVYLDAKFKMFIRWFEKKQKNKKEPTLFYNCSGAGYVFENIPNKNLKEFISLDKNKNINNFFETILNKIKEKNIDDYSKFMEDLKEVKSNIENFYNKIEQAIVLCNKAIKYHHQESSHKIFKQLQELDFLLINNFYGKDLVNISLQKAIQTINNKKKIDISLKENLEDSLYLYREMKESSKLNLKYLKEIITQYEVLYFKK